MNIKDQMLRGELYEVHNPEMIANGMMAKELIHKLNMTLGQKERDEVMRELIPDCGKNVVIVSPFFCDFGYNITIGDSVFINANCTFLDCNTIKIGSNVLIAPNVQIYAATHPLDYELRRTHELAKPVTIGDDSWIGGGAIICPGVTIGARCVVAAGSVVIHDVPDDSMVAGNPAVVKKKLRK